MNKQSAEQCRTVGGCGESCESRVYKCIVQTRYQQAKFLEKLKQTESLCVCFILVRFNDILACLFLQIWLGECTQCELALRPRFYLQLFLTCTRLQSFAPLQLAIWIVSVPFLYRCCTVRFRIRQRLLHLLNQLSGTVDIASFHANIQDTVEGNGIRLDLDTKPHSVSYNAAKCYKVLQWKPCGMRIDNKICSACSPISASNLIQPSTSIH